MYVKYPHKPLDFEREIGYIIIHANKGFNPMTDQITHPLYGRRVLHVISPVRWSAKKFQHQSDSNYQAVERTIRWLPMCHHYLLVPKNNTIRNDRENVTLVPFPYPGSVLYNRAFFDSKAFLEWFDPQKMDIDFVFCHQPELLYNIEGTLHVARIAPTLKKFAFFHWVDCPQSIPIGDYPEGFWRLIEAVSLSDKSFFHGQQAIEYLRSNFKKPKAVLGLNDEELNKKIAWMPTSIAPLPDKSEAFPLPKDKKILVFNHRWNNTAGIERLISYTEKLDRDKYLVWITDKDAAHPKAGSPAPSWMKVQNLPNGRQYRYLLENAYATLTFVDDYATWNLAVMDGVSVGTPGLVYAHPVMPEILGDSYNLYFKTKQEFAELVSATLVKGGPFKLPDHDAVFKENVLNAMMENIHVMKEEPKATREWLYHILKLDGQGYKRHLLANTHPNLFASNSWERVRCWCMEHGVLDDPNSKYTRLWVPDSAKERVEKLIEEGGVKSDLPTVRDPDFIVETQKKFQQFFG